MYVKQRISSQTVGESKSLWRGTLDEHGKEVWERNVMKPEMQTALLNTYPPKLIATILKALREQLKENDGKFGSPCNEHSEAV